MRHHDNIVSYLLAAGLAAGCGVVLTAFLGIWNLHESEAARYSTIVGIEERLNAGLDTFGRAAVDVDDDGRQIFVFVLDLAAAESLFPPGVVPELGSWHLSGAMTSRLSDQPGLSDRYSPSAELPDDLIVTGEDMVAIRFVATGSIDWPPAHFGLAVGKVEIMHADILRVVAPAALIALGALATIFRSGS